MVMMMGQFATQAVQPVVTLFVREMLGNVPSIATLAGLAFSATGLAGVIAVPMIVSMMILASDARLMQRYAIDTRVKIAGWAAAGVMTLVVAALCWSAFA